MTSNRIPKNHYEVRWIEVRLIEAHPEAQRHFGFSPRHAEKIADEFDPDKFGVLTVMPANSSGRFWCMDGAHRLEAVRTHLGWDDQTVPCIVKAKFDTADANRVFDGINASRPLSAIDRFISRVKYGRETESALHAALTDRGWQVDAAPSDGHFAAVGSAVTIHDRYGIDTFIEAIEIIQTAWGHDHVGANGDVVLGVAIAVDAGCDRARLQQRMSANGTPAQLLGNARSLRDIRRGTVAANVARVLADWHNTGLRSRKVEVK